VLILSYENVFLFTCKLNSFSYERMSTKTRFEERAKGNLEMAYSLSAQLYSVKIDEETQTPVPSEKREVPLNLKKHPVSATFGVFDE